MSKDNYKIALAEYNALPDKVKNNNSLKDALARVRVNPSKHNLNNFRWWVKELRATLPSN